MELEQADAILRENGYVPAQVGRMGARIAELALEVERYKWRAEMAEVALTAFVLAVDKFGAACGEYGANGESAPAFVVWYKQWVESQRAAAQP